MRRFWKAIDGAFKVRLMIDDRKIRAREIVHIQKISINSFKYLGNIINLNFYDKSLASKHDSPIFDLFKISTFLVSFTLNDI